MTYRNTVFVLVLFAVVSLLPGLATADSPTSGEDYVVQADDWLSKLADKFYGDPLAYPIIFDGTNAKATEDESYAPLIDPNEIEIGQKLYIPSIDDTPEILVETIAPIETMPEIAAETNLAPTEEQQQLLASLTPLGVPPELNNEIWLNSEPLRLADLHGKVVVIEFWTFG
jgi:hypothetical protein